MSAGSKIFGKDYLSSTPGREVWIPLRLLPDGSISTISSVVVDEGVATGGTNLTLIDTTKNWGVDIMEGRTVEITHIATGISYQRYITTNAATAISFDDLGVAVLAGDTYRILIANSPMEPQVRATVHNTAYLTPADFLGAALAPIISPSLFRCQVACTVSGIFYVTITRAGNTQTVAYNHAVALPAGALFEFDTLVADGDTINYQYGINCTIQTFKVLEIPSAI